MVMVCCITLVASAQIFPLTSYLKVGQFYQTELLLSPSSQSRSLGETEKGKEKEKGNEKEKGKEKAKAKERDSERDRYRTCRSELLTCLIHQM